MAEPMDPKQQHMRRVQHAAKQRMAKIALTPKDMSEADMRAKLNATGTIDDLAAVQAGGNPAPIGGVPQAPANVLHQAPAAHVDPSTPAEKAARMPPPAAPAPKPGGEIGPGVHMSPEVQIKVTPGSPHASAMPDPHAPEVPGEAEGDMDEDDYRRMPFRMG